MNSLWTGCQHWVQQEVVYPLPEQCSNVLYQPGCVGMGNLQLRLCLMPSICLQQ